MDNSKLVGLVFLDLSKAFDLVSHDILLSKIAKYHTSKQPLRWFRSYLCDRTKTYNISGVLSDPFTLDCLIDELLFIKEKKAKLNTQSGSIKAKLCT